MEKQVYSIKELQSILQLGRNAVSKLIHDEKIKSVRAGGKILIPVWAVDEFLGKSKEV